jgi:transaldolase/glucose-6-phosphate isomerase
MKEWDEKTFFAGLQHKDPLLWSLDTDKEISDRLGWLSLPETMMEKCAAFEEFSRQVRAENFEYIVLLGMGGSSLAPEVFQKVLGNASGFPRLVVCDTTHPDGILTVEKSVDLERTMFLVSSKSGTTLETLSLFHYFWKKITRAGKNPGTQFAAITDPQTPLYFLAREHGFRYVFQAPSDVGGRFSALSDFGLVPAALIGVDIQSLLIRVKGDSEDAEDMVSGLRLGEILGKFAKGRNKLTILSTPLAAGFTYWLEQLIAESLGKKGKGLIPILEEPVLPADRYGADRSFVFLLSPEEKNRELLRFRKDLKQEGHSVASINIHDRMDIGKEMFKWEVAVAAAGTVMGVHPFNQPDVQLTKELTRKVMSRKRDTKNREDTSAGQWADAINRFCEQCSDGDYIALQAFLPPEKKIKEILQEIRLRLLDKTGTATTIGFGPRFMHSTGQLHKGGPNNGLFIQVVDIPHQDIPVPEAGYSFGQLIAAQSYGDYSALKQKGRRIIRVQIEEDTARGLEAILKRI